LKMNTSCTRICTALITALLALSCFVSLSQAQLALRKISVDKFTNQSSQHKSEVEPDTYAWGSTIVSAFQVARISSGGGADIGFATSIDAGATWTMGYLPGLTKNYKNGPFSAASDASVAFDAKHGQWLISALPLGNAADVSVSRSTDGIHWGRPIPVDRSGGDDKNWIVCDNTSTSPFYGNCYSEWDNPTIFMSTSSDGGQTWGSAKMTGDRAAGSGGQPLVQPNGTVVVPIAGGNGLIAFTSTDGGATWSRTSSISNVNEHGEQGGLRSAGLPGAEIDASGKIYVVWSDCRFRTNCNTNDLVLSTSSDGKTWTAPARIPIDATSSTVDHFIPGLGVDPNTSGATAHLALTYYYYPVSACGNSCQLDVGFVTSDDGGNTWTAGQQLAGPMQLTWLPDTFSGVMVADYLSTSFVNGNAFGAFVIANAPTGGVLDQAVYTTMTPLAAPLDAPRFSAHADRPVPNAKGDFVRKYYDDEHRFRIPPSKR
jgi:hypothetical protein